MAYVKVEVTIYKSLGYQAHRGDLIVGSHRINLITKESVIELFKGMVTIFRDYNRIVRGTK